MNLKKLFKITSTVKLVKTLKRQTQIVIAYSYFNEVTFLRHTSFITHISIHISGEKTSKKYIFWILYC